MCWGFVWLALFNVGRMEWTERGGASAARRSIPATPQARRGSRQSHLVIALWTQKRFQYFLSGTFYMSSLVSALLAILWESIKIFRLTLVLSPLRSSSPFLLSSSRSQKMKVLKSSFRNEWLRIACSMKCIISRCQRHDLKQSNFRMLSVMDKYWNFLETSTFQVPELVTNQKGSNKFSQVQKCSFDFVYFMNKGRRFCWEPGKYHRSQWPNARVESSCDFPSQPKNTICRKTSRFALPSPRHSGRRMLVCFHGFRKTQGSHDSF